MLWPFAIMEVSPAGFHDFTVLRRDDILSSAQGAVVPREERNHPKAINILWCCFDINILAELQNRFKFLNRIRDHRLRILDPQFVVPRGEKYVLEPVDQKRKASRDVRKIMRNVTSNN
eukprot:GAFH01003208.1.p2 GENE.GAFH01003208.1~~GAFH01003208.1.p2  ORF type:complete len:118 (-),score=4.57 GAFH01003208.1:121-474(-)